ncbi:MAG: alpha/beta hydrolase [Alphaproteobacteria bacterium]|nr:alpha/beta hydrolase [Alphaproteobacteria bacterium]
MAEGLAACGIRTARFEFEYLAQVRRGASRRPPPKMPILEEEFRVRIAAHVSSRPLFIGGKSMGGRVASLIADDMFSAGHIAGIVCLGYPFHPVGKPEKLRTAHLKDLSAPALICQGTRDPFGTTEDVAGYELSDQIEIEWLEDGDHGFKSRKRSGATHEQNMVQAIEATARFMNRQIS